MFPKPAYGRPFSTTIATSRQTPALTSGGAHCLPKTAGAADDAKPSPATVGEQSWVEQW
ncbi:hypothetical protein ZHAS_00012719 [Anopheles sinensis]|uniref:Uncharacterized protein n=1 Tax=Anopheles sinensis TaxID=74873 RepID=A0A084W3L6_ANOSI|nr:hypothetical protein ZHAS_00012719 [Anopheles sinensis]